MSPLGEVGVDSPVSSFVGVGQRRAPDRGANAHVVELGRLRRKTGFDVSQTFSISQLSEGKDAKVLGTRQGANTTVPAIAIDDTSEGCPRQKIHQLREQRPCRCTWRGPPGIPALKVAQKRGCVSSRHHKKSAKNIADSHSYVDPQVT